MGLEKRSLPMIEWLTTLAENEVLVAGIVFAATAMLIALWMPGVLLPIAASSGAVMNAWIAAGVVSLGALVGSLVIFATTRRIAKDRVPARIAAYLERFESRLQSRGAWMVLGLRLVGTPHFLVSSASALTPMRASSFSLATLAGTMPAILMAALAGSAV